MTAPAIKTPQTRNEFLSLAYTTIGHHWHVGAAVPPCGTCIRVADVFEALVVGAREPLLATLKRVEWQGEAHDRDESWPCCPACGAPAPNVSFHDASDVEAGVGVHVPPSADGGDPGCYLANAIAAAEGRS